MNYYLFHLFHALNAPLCLSIMNNGYYRFACFHKHTHKQTLTKNERHTRFNRRDQKTKKKNQPESVQSLQKQINRYPTVILGRFH